MSNISAYEQFEEIDVGYYEIVSYTVVALLRARETPHDYVVSRALNKFHSVNNPFLFLTISFSLTRRDNNT